MEFDLMISNPTTNKQIHIRHNLVYMCIMFYYICMGIGHLWLDATGIKRTDTKLPTVYLWTLSVT